MSSGLGRSKEEKFRPADGMDEALRQELDDALGGKSLEEVIAAEDGQAPAAAAAVGQAGRGVKRGKVIAIQGDDIFVDMGGKSQGILPVSQFEDAPLPAVGDTVDVTIEGYDRADGLLLLSRQGAVLAVAWQTIEEGQVVEGRVTDHNKGGLEISIDGIEAFMPISQIEMYRLEDLAPYVNRRLRCQVVEVDHEEQKVIVSRRLVLEQELAQAREQTFAALEEGKVVAGTVKTIMPYGAFVDIGGFDGLLHVKEMSYSRVEDPKTVVKEGDKIQVKILKVDRETRRISLGLKQVMPDPWTDATVKYPVDSTTAGRVTRLADFGAFVELEPGIEGLAPIGEMTFERRIKHPSEVVQPGDVVRVRVMNVDVEKRRIGLSIKRAGADPWVGASARWPVGSVAEGRVTRITQFGAFVELTAGVEALVHISELSADRVRAVNEAVREGQAVQAKVLSVDEDERRISLSIKQLATMPDYTGPVAQEAAVAPTPRKRKKPLKGGLD